MERYKPLPVPPHIRPVVDMAHYGIFRQELAFAYPTYGNALWEPDPGGQYNAVEVGDVGFIRRGHFLALV